MLEILQVILMIACFLLTIVGVFFSAIIFSKREDKSFWGGANLYNGLWLLFPYGENGIGEKTPEKARLVLTARILAVLISLTGFAAYKIKDYI